MPVRIQRQRGRGWRLPAGCVCVTRPGRWGNPWQLLCEGWPAPFEMARIMAPRIGDTPPRYLSVPGWQVRQAMAENFAADLLAGRLSVTIAEAQAELAGHDLACWCAPGTPCHADVLLRFANEGRPA